MEYLEIIEELSKSNNLNSIKTTDYMKEVLQRSCDCLNCERSNIWLLNETGDELCCAMALNKSSQQFLQEGSLKKSDLPIYFNHILKDEILVSSDAQADPSNVELLDGYLKVHQITSMIDVPLRSEGKMIGVICFEHVDELHEWTYKEQKFTQSVAHLLSLALETKEKLAYRSKLEKIIEEKEVLLSEINHRVKNNMSVIVSLLNLQKNKSLDVFHTDLFEGLKDKVYSMSMIQEQLHKSKNINQIDFQVYIRSLVMNINNSYGSHKKVDIQMDLDAVTLSVSKAIPCGLIANEVLTNSFKYGFDKKNLEPTLKVSLKRSGKQVELRLSDNGAGLHQNQMNSGMGLELIEGLAGQINGRISFNNSNGLSTSLLFTTE